MIGYGARGSNAGRAMDATPSFWDQLTAWVGAVFEAIGGGLGALWGWFAALPPEVQLGVVGSVIAIVGVPTGVLLGVRRARAAAARKREEEEREEKILGAVAKTGEDQRELSAEARAEIAEVKKLLLAQAGDQPVDETTAASIEAALEGLAASGNARKQAALDKAAGGDVAGAGADLMALGAEQESAVDRVIAETAETYKQAGALAFLNDTQRALDAYEKAIALTPDDAATRNQLGHLYLRVGRLDDAQAAYQTILAAAGAHDKEWEAKALGNLGLVAQTRGDLAAAEDYHRRSLALEEELGRKEGMADTLCNLGTVALTRGDLDAAEDYYSRALALEEELGRKEGMANQLAGLGLVSRTRGDLDAAEDYHRRALALNEELGRKEGMASDLGNLGLVSRTRGDLAAAEDYHRRSLALEEELGRKAGMASDLGNLGVVAETRGDLDAAEDYHRRSLALNEELGGKEGMARQLANLGGVAQARGDMAEACRLWAQSVALYKEVGIPHMVEQVSGLMRAAGCGDEPS